MPRRASPPCLYPDQIHGIAVRWSRDVEYACARGLFFWKEILVGPAFCRLPERIRMAILMHEAGHCKRHHLEIRLLTLPMLAWVFFRSQVIHPEMSIEQILTRVGIESAFFKRLYSRQEIEADAYAAAHGYSDDLIDFLVTTRSGGLYPSTAERIEALL